MDHLILKSKEELHIIALRACIKAVVDEALSVTDEQYLVRSAHAMATNLLRIKFSRTPGIKHRLGLSEYDLGFDCIAELFERDSRGTLIHFKTYFSNFHFDSLSSKEVLLHFRRLISSAVNQNLAHIYRDFDPGLGKIIRNIKLSVAAHKTYHEIDRFDQVCLAPVDIPLDEHLPMVDQNDLFALLTEAVRGTEFVPELLSTMSRAIREQKEFSKCVPLITIAVVFRMLMIVKQEPSPVSSSDNFAQNEMEEIISRNITIVKATILSHNHHGPATADLIDTYFRTIHNLFLSKIDSPGSSADSLFTGLQEHVPGLSFEQYKSDHRTKIEYYYRLCREAISSDLLEKKNQ